ASCPDCFFPFQFAAIFRLKTLDMEVAFRSFDEPLTVPVAEISQEPVSGQNCEPWFVHIRKVYHYELIGGMRVPAAVTLSKSVSVVQRGFVAMVAVGNKNRLVQRELANLLQDGPVRYR